jgi:hypothetical protein
VIRSRPSTNLVRVVPPYLARARESTGDFEFRAKELPLC